MSLHKAYDLQFQFLTNIHPENMAGDGGRGDNKQGQISKSMLVTTAQLVVESVICSHVCPCSYSTG